MQSNNGRRRRRHHARTTDLPVTNDARRELKTDRDTEKETERKKEEKTDLVEFEVEAAGVADGFPLSVAAPQSRRRRGAVGADQIGAPVATPAASSVPASSVPLL